MQSPAPSDHGLPPHAYPQQQQPQFYPAQQAYPPQQQFQPHQQPQYVPQYAYGAPPQQQQYVQQAGSSSSSGSSGGGVSSSGSGLSQLLNLKPHTGGTQFAKENDRIVNVGLEGNFVWIKRGSMIAYTGRMKFVRESLLSHGLGKMIKRAVADEHLFLTKAEGSGNLFLADWGKAVKVVHLKNESLVLNGSNLLAFEPSLNWNIKVMKGTAGWVEGGLFNVTFNGTGHLALTTMFEPITLPVSRGNPVRTSPGATVAWSGNLKPALRFDVQLKSLFGRSSGDSVQMEFEGDSGFVVVQPFEYIQK